MATPNSNPAATPSATSKIWPDLSAYDVRLAVVELPDRRRVYALMGAEKALSELGDLPQRLGFKRAQTGHFLVRDATGAASQLKIGELRAAFPKMTMRETLFSEIASAAKGKNSTSRERREVARMMNANPLGVNYLGEIIFNGAAGRFTRLVDGSTRVEAEAGTTQKTKENRRVSCVEIRRLDR